MNGPTSSEELDDFFGRSRSSFRDIDSEQDDFGDLARMRRADALESFLGPSRTLFREIDSAREDINEQISLQDAVELEDFNK